MQAVPFPVFAVILKCSNSFSNDIHQNCSRRDVEGLAWAYCMREKEWMSFYLLPASCLLQDACQLRQSTVEGSKRQKISSVKIVTSNQNMECWVLQKGDFQTMLGFFINLHLIITVQWSDRVQMCSFRMICLLYVTWVL